MRNSEGHTNYNRRESAGGNMVTNVPTEVGEELVREGVALAIASRIEQAANDFARLAQDVRGSLVERNAATGAFANLLAMQDEALAAMEFARVFVDQWPDDGDDDTPHA